MPVPKVLLLFYNLYINMICSFFVFAYAKYKIPILEQ